MASCLTASKSGAPSRHLADLKLLIIDELGYAPLSLTGSEPLFEVFSQRYERGSTIVTSNLPFEDWTSVFSSERLIGALLDRLTHQVHILEMNGDSTAYSKQTRNSTKGPSRGPSCLNHIAITGLLLIRHGGRILVGR